MVKSATRVLITTRIRHLTIYMAISRIPGHKIGKTIHTITTKKGQHLLSNNSKLLASICKTSVQSSKN